MKKLKKGSIAFFVHSETLVSVLSAFFILCIFYSLYQSQFQTHFLQYTCARAENILTNHNYRERTLVKFNSQNERKERCIAKKRKH